MGKIIILNGGSGSGKTELAKQLQNKTNLPFKIVKAVTDCTRQPRTNETHGKDYYFRTKEEFESRIANGEYVEYSLYDGTYRGLRKKELEKHLKERDTIVLLIMDMNGVNSIKNIFPNETISIHIAVSRDVLEDRMKKRGDTKKDIESRLAYYDSSNEKENANKCDKILNNDTTIEKLVDECEQYLKEII